MAWIKALYKASSLVIGDDVVEQVQQFIRNGKILKELNVTAVYLIPKISNSSNLGDYRPTYCYHILYKCITKLIFSMLKLVLTCIISLDTLDLEFIKGMLMVLNFPSQLIIIVIASICSTQFSLILNGSLMPFFKSNRGIRHGDPMFLLMFVLCMECLSRLLSHLSRYKASWPYV